MGDIEQIDGKWSDRFFSVKTALITTTFAMSILVVAFLLFVFFRSWNFSWILDEQIVAQFGDFVGGVVGTLLAFSAAILYYVALKEQRKDVENNKKSLELQNQALQQQIEEFKQQRVELEETRKVYERQTQLMSEQSHILKRQQFESSFYSMMRVYMDLKSHINSKETESFHSCIESIQRNLPSDISKNKIFDRHKAIQTSFETVYLEKKDVLSPYFKTVHRILCIIDHATSLDNNEKMQYVKIFRAQLSDCETALLFYNYHSDFSGSSRNISYKFNFLKHYDYLYSLDAQIRHDVILQQDKELILFLHQFEDFIKESINTCCDISEEEPPLQMEFEYKKIISQIVSTPDIIITLSIPVKSEKLHDDFCSLFSDYICDRIFLSQFSKKKELVELKEMGEVDSRRVYCCTLHKPFVQKIKMDDDYE